MLSDWRNWLTGLSTLFVHHQNFRAKGRTVDMSSITGDSSERKQLLREVAILSRDVARLRETATRLSTEMMPLAKARRRWALLTIFAIITVPVMVVVLLLFSRTQTDLDKTVSEFRKEAAASCERRNEAAGRQAQAAQSLRAFITELSAAERVSQDPTDVANLRVEAFNRYLTMLGPSNAVPPPAVDCSAFTR